MRFKKWLEMAMPSPGEERILTKEKLTDVIRNGWINVVRLDGYAGQASGSDASALTRGRYYYVGNSDDPVLKIGKPLVAQNKVHALMLLGISKDFLYQMYNDLPYDAYSDYDTYSKNKQDFLNHFKSKGNTSYRDTYDNLLAYAAKTKGYDTIILLREGQTVIQRTEIIDLTPYDPQTFIKNKRNKGHDHIMRNIRNVDSLVNKWQTQWQQGNRSPMPEGDIDGEI